MADRPRAALPSPAARQQGPASSTDRQQQHSMLGRAVQTTFHHGSTQQFLGFLALAVTLTALLVLAGVTLTAALAALLLLTFPLALLTFPLWAPVAVVALLTGAASLLACCAVVAAVAAGTWARRRYFTGRHPVGAHLRVESADDDYARGSTVADVASRVRRYYDAYAREYGGYPPRPHARVKDAAPGA